jgi:hypothetical protein
MHDFHIGSGAGADRKRARLLYWKSSLAPFLLPLVVQRIPLYSVRLVTSSRWYPNWVCTGPRTFPTSPLKTA